MSNRYYSITIWYNTHDEGVKHYVVNNVAQDKYLQLREQIFSCGLAVKDKDDPTCGDIIPPWQIVQIKWFLQEKFFPGVMNTPLKKTAT